MSSRRRRDTIFLCFDSRNNRIRRPADLGICLDPDRFAFRAEEVGDQVWNQINFGDSAQKSNLCFFASGTPKYPSRGRCSRFRQADGEFTMSSSVLTTVRLEVDTLKIRDLKMTWIGLIWWVTFLCEFTLSWLAHYWSVIFHGCDQTALDSSWEDHWKILVPITNWANSLDKCFGVLTILLHLQ